MPLPYNHKHRERARELRSKMTREESLLWARLRKKQIGDAQFYRQKPIGHYVVDFYCARANLVVELDGAQHRDPDHTEADRLRDEALGQLGLRTLRFSNRAVREKLDGVVDVISQAVGARLGG